MKHIYDFGKPLEQFKGKCTCGKIMDDQRTFSDHTKLIGHSMEYAWGVDPSPSPDWCSGCGRAKTMGDCYNPRCDFRLTIHDI